MYVQDLVKIRNLIIYKKALFNADSSSENELLEILKPITNSNSVWKAHSLYLMAEYFYAEEQNQKAKEFLSERFCRPQTATGQVLDSWTATGHVRPGLGSH